MTQFSLPESWSKEPIAPSPFAINIVFPIKAGKNEPN